MAKQKPPKGKASKCKGDRFAVHFFGSVSDVKLHSRVNIFQEKQVDMIGFFEVFNVFRESFPRTIMAMA